MKKHKSGKFRIHSILAIICWMLFPIQANNINSGGQKGLARILSVETNGRGTINTGAAFKIDMDSYFATGPQREPYVINLSDGSALLYGTSYLYSGNVFANYGIADNWDFSASFPFYHDRNGWNITRSALGDMELTTKLRYPDIQDKLIVNQAYCLKIVLPTGNVEEGVFPRHAYNIRQGSDSNSVYATDEAMFIPNMLWTINFEHLSKSIPVQVHINLGAALKNSNSIVAGLGVEYHPNNAITLFMESYLESRFSHYDNYFSTGFINDDILLITPGIRADFKNNMFIIFALDFGIPDANARSEWAESGYRYSTAGSPVFGLQFTLGWTCALKKDRTIEGTRNEKDRCSDKPGGCAPAKQIEDRDGDGIPDSLDKCPDEAEDFDGFQDEDGCPDPDNDQDWIPDYLDKCPNEPEDYDGFEDDDGCPDPDNDNDGICDPWVSENGLLAKYAHICKGSDKCPDDKGPVENNGCPF